MKNKSIINLKTNNSMNREIKFRAWDGKRMTTSGIMFNTSTGVLVTPVEARMKLMQFTGLHDKNGKEIYEGDIVLTEKYIMTGESYSRVGVIKYRNDITSFVFEEQEGGWDSIEIVSQVIGNEYQNPELCNH